MLKARITDATNFFGAPDGWDPEKDGICHVLPVRAEMVGRLLELSSAWTPTPDELDRLNRGASVILTIVGASHPPVRLTVGDVPA